MKLRRLAILVALVTATLATIFACSTPSSDPRFVATTPDRASFPAVSELLGHRCGTLDCHGNSYRNLRIYGHEGLRLDGMPTAQGMTTVAEYDQNFQSIVGLEPELMSAVVSQGGAQPERLTFVRKARGAEDHKGGSLMKAGDIEDQCITSWLAGRTDLAACANARDAAF
jgi:hypothetical protein